MVRNTQDNDLNNYNLININSITLNEQAENDNEVIRNAYVDQFHQENERSRRDLGLLIYNEEVDLVKNNQDKIFNDKKLTKLDSITVNRNPSLDHELANKKYIDDEVDKKTFLLFNQTLEIYLKVSVGNDTYSLNKYDKIQITDTTIIKTPNNVCYLLQNWVIKCNDKNGNGKISNFIKPTEANSPTGNSRATSLPPIGDSFMYIETTSKNKGDNVFCSFERTDTIKIPTEHSITTDFQQVVLNQWVDSEFNYYYKILLGVLIILSLKLIVIVIHRLIGHHQT